VLGETGCGKTTQIPQYLIGPEYHKLLGNPAKPLKVVVTQPRRVAAISLATRVAEEVGCRLGTTVGYTVRFDDCSEAKTRLKYVTDGTLLQEMLSDKLLSNYDIVIIDEAHERSLRTDMLLGFLKGIQRTRRTMVEDGSDFPKKKSNQQGSIPARPLKVIIMSATIDAERFSQFFDELSPHHHHHHHVFPLHLHTGFKSVSSPRIVPRFSTSKVVSTQSPSFMHKIHRKTTSNLPSRPLCRYTQSTPWATCLSF